MLSLDDSYRHHTGKIEFLKHQQLVFGYPNHFQERDQLKPQSKAPLSYVIITQKQM